MTTQEGGCLCGAVRIKVEGDPIAAGTCYCRDCQYVAGGGAAYGVMDDPSWFQSQGSIWASSAQPWHRPEPGLPAWRKNPEAPADS